MPLIFLRNKIIFKFNEKLKIFSFANFIQLLELPHLKLFYQLQCHSSTSISSSPSSPPHFLTQLIPYVTISWLIFWLKHYHWCNFDLFSSGFPIRFAERGIKRKAVFHFRLFLGFIAPDPTSEGFIDHKKAVRNLRSH